ncbi:alkane 1-monooxygenase [Tenacibaculum skagerrakense]|uniref:Alkane 1-monooxygenase n=1 Tax=Tenacibaculum skagerrakense TaxID=186571 RepID=A0A4R2NPH1_9FLAO|nr:alkane 1-monooxygenase [Tenacibaculum skagerrakense]TCP23660.1 alkane 1-monooxygenase [Tenacibaculum skagerrakense]
MKALKYLLVFTIPLTVYVSFTSTGWITFLPLIYVFGIVPLSDMFLKVNAENFDKEQEEIEKNNKLYSYILYLTLPVQVGFLIWFLFVINETASTIDLIGRISAMGIMCGVIGINVGHELGHRNNRFEELLGEILLMTSLETHFLPYHNAGHHFNVATLEDAATARKNEPLYIFWIRSQFMSYIQAWKLENKRMTTSERSWFHHQNRMLIYTICHALLVGAIFFFFGVITTLYFLAAAIFGILLLETVNYIEHYGLLRDKNKFGRYERVKHTHSWNSNHVIGKLVLFNLSRHSDHHYNGSKHYQILKSLPESPQMPTGYPGMMLLSLIPPIWFKVMNKKLQEI